MGSFIRNGLNTVANSNQQNSDHLITVVYGETNTTDPNTIRNLKNSLDEWTNYKVSFDYDENGYINKMTIN